MGLVLIFCSRTDKLFIICPYWLFFQMRNQEQGGQGQRHSTKQQEYDTFLYKFQQQMVDAWKPIPHTSTNVILYIILSVICITIGITLIETSTNTQEVYLRYDNVCTPNKNTKDNSANSPCRLTFTLTSPLPAPVYFYYGFKGFYQNHRRYLKYYSNNQLSTGDPYVSSGKTDCSDYYTNFETFGNNVHAVDGSILRNSQPAFPCGTISRMYYQLRDEIQGFRLYDQGKHHIPISQTGIAWPADIGMHVNAADSQMAFRVTEETWLVWFRPAASSDFYKLNGVINQALPAGTYTLAFKNQVAPTWGEKWISFSKSNYEGNQDRFLAIVFLVVGGCCILILIVFVIKLVMQKNEQSKFQ